MNSTVSWALSTSEADVGQAFRAYDLFCAPRRRQPPAHGRIHMPIDLGRAYLLGEQQIEGYRRNGFIKLKDVFNADELAHITAQRSPASRSR
jgi:hypothetical protein